MDFQEADRRYVEIKQRQETGDLTQKEFDEQLKQLMVQDEEGRWWVKSPTTGEWYYHDGTAWVKDTPPGYQAPQAAPEDQPEIQQSESLEDQALTRRLAAIYAEGQQHMDAEEWQQALERFEEVQRLKPGYRDTEELLSQSRQRLSADRAAQVGRDDLASATYQGSQAESHPNISTESAQSDHLRTRLEQQDSRKIYDVVGIMALVIAGILFIGLSYGYWWLVISPATFEAPSFLKWIYGLLWILMLAGLVELHARHATSYGRFVLAAFVVAYLGNILNFITGFLEPESTSLQLALVALSLPWDVGLVLLGTVILQGGVLPRWSGWLLVSSGIIGAIADLMWVLLAAVTSITGTSGRLILAGLGIRDVLLGLSLVLLGYILWTRRLTIQGGNQNNN